MKIAREDITIEFLRECFDMEVSTGKLIWKDRPLHHFPNVATQRAVNARRSGTVAGSVNKSRKDRRIVVFFDGMAVMAHRIVYAMAMGIGIKDVPTIVDHINVNASDNRPDNLRAATPTESAHNRRVSTISKTGVKGVIKTNGKARPYRAHIRFRGYKVPLGSFATLEEAAAAYRKAATDLHGEFARA